MKKESEMALFLCPKNRGKNGNIDLKIRVKKEIKIQMILRGREPSRVKRKIREYHFTHNNQVGVESFLKKLENKKDNVKHKSMK